MNRKHLLGIGLLTAAMLLTGCSAEILDGHSGQVPIYLTASVQEGGAQGMTRAGTDVQSTQLPNGEEFYGYFPSGATVSSATFTANGSGGTTANPQPYFTFSGTETTVHAYHGKSGGTDQVTNETSSFSVATDQSSDAAYRASDLMYATATVTKSGLSATGELTFSHKMAKIIVNATMGSGITSISAVKIVGGSKTINIATPQSCTLGTSLSGDNSSTDITVFSGTHTSGTLNCAALIPPQRVPAEGSTATNFLQIETNAGTVTYSLNGKDFASNNVYTFTVTLTASQAGTTVAITDWADNGNATVTVEGACNGVDITSETDVAVGGYICSHGKYISSLSGCGGKAVARITYVGSVPGYFDKFLAIAMEDAASSYADWATQMSAANTWASNHPVTVGGTTYNSCSTSAYDQVTTGGTTSMPNSGGTAVKGWRVPSVTDWKYIFDGIGGKAVDNSAVTDGIDYSSGTNSGGSDGSHRALLNKWCGQAWNATTNPQAVQSGSYWSSSERAESTNRAWGYRFSYSRFNWYGKSERYYVRAVFAY